MDCSTLYYFRNLLQRRSVTKKVKNDPTASQEFFLLVLEAFVLYAVMSELQMSSVDCDPHDNDFKDFTTKSKEQRNSLFNVKMRCIVDRCFNFGKPKNTDKDRDVVKLHAEEIFSLGLFFMEYVDAIREGDGTRILCCWKYMMLLFKATNKTKYSLEAFNLLAHYRFLFSERLANQLLWSRTVNVHGKPGHNIPMDLHMEHLNRIFKSAISRLGPNTIGPSLHRTGRAIRPISNLQSHFDSVTNVPVESSYHSTPNTKKDLLEVIRILQEEVVYTDIPNRRFKNFKSVTGSVMNNVDDELLNTWMNTQLKNIVQYM